MRPVAPALLWLLLTSPAAAQFRAPSPCEHYVPTGEKLPRQEDAPRSMLLIAVPNPTYRDKPVAKTWPGEPVTIVQECGVKLRIRTVRGEEGWVPVGMLPNESKIYERARRRPPQSDAGCAQRLLDPRLIEACQHDLATKRDKEREAQTATYLPAGEVAAFVSGQTLILHPRDSDVTDDPAFPTKSYFAPDGEVFMRAGNHDSMLWRGRWVVQGDTVCLPGGYTSCARLRKLADGGIAWVPGNYVTGFLIERSAGDTAGTVAAATKRFPQAKLPPPPEGAEDIARPSLGR